MKNYNKENSSEENECRKDPNIQFRGIINDERNESNPSNKINMNNDPEVLLGRTDLPWRRNQFSDPEQDNNSE